MDITIQRANRLIPKANWALLKNKTDQAVEVHIVFRRRGQTSFEQMVIIIIVMAVFLSIGTYFKRGIQGRWKVAVDDVGDQYDPRVMDTDYTFRSSGTTTSITRVTQQGDGFWTARFDNSTSSDTRSGYMRVNAY